ncbi:MAG TPA: hypothetical protein PKU94_02420 [Candidatus Hydrothermia bacterium]|nr:hypothetical protein [Candidatus Hydrothermia bacterium]
MNEAVNNRNNRKPAFLLAPLLSLYIAGLNFKVRGTSELIESPITLHNLNRVIGLILALICIFMVFTRYRNLRIKSPKTMRYILIYTIIGTISTIILSQELLGYSIYKALELITCSLLGIFTFSVSELYTEYHEEAINFSVGYLKLLLFIVILNLMYLGNAAFTGYEEIIPSRRLICRVPSISPNELGFVAVIVICYEMNKKIHKPMDYLWLLISLIVLILSKAKAATIAGLISLVIFILKKEGAGKYLLLIMIVCPLVFFRENIISYYYASSASEAAIRTLSGRTLYWTDAWNHFKIGSPIEILAGSGFATSVRRFVSSYAGETGTSLDNDIMNSLLSAGLLGAIAIVLFYVRLIYLVIKNMHTSPFVLYTGLILLIRGMTVTNVSLFNFLAPFLVIFAVYLEEQNTRRLS